MREVESTSRQKRGGRASRARRLGAVYLVAAGFDGDKSSDGGRGGVGGGGLRLLLLS